MSHSAAYDLSYTARIISSRHIKKFFLKSRFEGEVELFIKANAKIITNASSDKACREAINNIKQEKINLERQSTMLSLEQGKVFMAVSMERNKKEIDCSVDGISLIVNGAEFPGGFRLVAKSVYTPGKLSGFYVILSNADSASKEIMHFLANNSYTGITENIWSYTAETAGLKPSATRLFYYLSVCYYRKINSMSKSDSGGNNPGEQKIYSPLKASMIFS